MVDKQKFLSKPLGTADLFARFFFSTLTSKVLKMNLKIVHGKEWHTKRYLRKVNLKLVNVKTWL